MAPPHERMAVVDHAVDSRGLSTASSETAAWLSLVAYVRHTFTEYDELLAEGYDADSARHFVAARIDGNPADLGPTAPGLRPNRLRWVMLPLTTTSISGTIRGGVTSDERRWPLGRMSVQAGAPERKRRTSLRQSLRAMRDNASTAYAPEDFSADIIEQRILWSRRFVINQPEGIHTSCWTTRRTGKSEVGRRVLEPALGRGLLTNEGDTWRRHRRIMAPAFDPRGIAGYATIMAEAAATLGKVKMRSGGATVNSISPLP